jgi:hypothetical protein
MGVEELVETVERVVVVVAVVVADVGAGGVCDSRRL